MTDTKTVRDALEFYANKKAYRNRNPILDEFDPEACIHGAIHDDKGKRATEALAALDRIEAVDTVTVAELNNLIRSEAHCYTPGMTLFVNFPNGLRIVREK